MFIILLKFAANKAKASSFMQGHNEWLAQGFEEDVFLLSGTLQPAQGGTIIAHNTNLAELEERVRQDPFVAENIVSTEILEISAAKTDERLNFLLG